MAAYVTLHGLKLRPHVKTHKSPRIAAEQLRLGAVGLSCATLREAEIMAEVCDDLLIAYPPVGAARLERLARLPKDVRVSVAADDIQSLDACPWRRARPAHVDVRVEVDLGMHRVGVTTPERPSPSRAISTAPPGSNLPACSSIGHIRSHVGEQDALLQSRHRSRCLHRRPHRCGAAAGVVSGGSTPAAWRMHEIPGVTEVRPGTYVATTAPPPASVPATGTIVPSPCSPPWSVSR